MALIVEPRVEGSFEFCVRNVLAHLGADWGLEVGWTRTLSHYRTPSAYKIYTSHTTPTSHT